MKPKLILLLPCLLLGTLVYSLFMTNAGDAPRVIDRPARPGDNNANTRSSPERPGSAAEPDRKDVFAPAASYGPAHGFTISWPDIQQIAKTSIGTVVGSSGAFEGTVLSSGQIQGRADTWMVAIRIHGESEHILTIAKEPDQRILARMYSHKAESAWRGASHPGEPLILEKVHRDEILPVCASPPTGNGVSGSNSGVVPLRQSLPGSLRVLYLDFDGEDISGTTWNVYENAGNPINAISSGLSTTEIERVWQEVSEDFRPFQVNVTTDRAAYEAAFTGHRMMVVMTRTDGWYNDKYLPEDKAGGVAYRPSFGNVSDRVCWVFTNQLGGPSDIAMAASHEFGHTLGLGHYGNSFATYYRGHGSGLESWGPIMGAPYSLRISQWSNGDYPGAVSYLGSTAQSPPQNDVSVISAFLPLRTDEDSSTTATARNLRPNSSLDTPTALTLAGEGIIHSRTDVDYLYFDAPSAGQLLVNAMPFASTAGKGVNLNLRIRLLNSGGTALATAAPASDPSAQIAFPVAAAGRFLVEIDGAGKDGSAGYSDYGALGCYLVRGAFTATGPPVIARQPEAVSRVVLGGGFSLAVQASGAATLNYQWQKRSSSTAAWQNIGLNQATYSVAVSAAGDSGQYRVTISNSLGSSPSQTATVTVGTLPSNVQYQWMNFAGKAGGAGSGDGVGQLATFEDPGFLSAAPDGSILIGDARGVRRMHRNGVVQTLYEGNAGSPVQDSGGNIYMALSNAILRRAPDGTVATYAGLPGSAGYVNGSRLTARFRSIGGIALHPAGGLVLIDDYVIRRIDASGQVSAVAGSPGAQDYVDGTGAAARFYSPGGIVVDSAGVVYTSDNSAHTIRRITAGGAVSTFAGRAYYYGSTDGPRTDARFHGPAQLTLDAQGRLLIADRGAHTIRQIDTSGVVSTIAGKYLGFGDQDGAAVDARFANPAGIAAMADGTVFISEYIDRHRIRRFSGGIVSTVAGSTRLYGDTDGIGENVRFGALRGLDVAADGVVYAISGHSIRKLLPHGESFAFAGSGSVSGTTEGNAASARFYAPRDIAITSAGVIYVADSENHVIRRITATGVVSTFAGTPGEQGYVNASGTAARFGLPEGIAVDGSGNLFVYERDKTAIRKITPAGAVSLFAGSPTEDGYVNGAGLSARFRYPIGGVACDTQGNVYVSDTGNNVIRKITPGGSVSTLAGTPGDSGSVDGPGTVAKFSKPGHLVVDRLGNVLAVDGLWFTAGNHTIRRIRADGNVSTIGGLANRPGLADGIGSGALFSQPSGIAVSSGGTIYVSEDGSGRIRSGTPALNLPSSISATPSGNTLPDTDGDGVSDQEELLAGTNPNDATSSLPVFQGFPSTQDSDGDGMSDADEVIAGTDPALIESVLRVTSIIPFRDTNGQDSLEIAFSARPERAYWLYRTESLSSPNWQPVAGPLTVTNGAALINVTLPRIGAKAFFRVKVVGPGG